jgi:hypothetical protein
MPRKQLVWFILIIRITATLTVVMVWIIRRPRQKIGGVLFSENSVRDCLAGLAFVSYVLAVSHKGHLMSSGRQDLRLRSRAVRLPARSRRTNARIY